LAVLIVLIVLLLTAGTIMLWQVMKPVPEPTTTVVPQVVGLTEANAKQAISNAGLAVGDVKHENGPDDSTKGTVIKQNPQKDTVVQLGSTVTITVNLGPLTGMIPQGLIGLTESAARTQLAGAAFTNVVSESATMGVLEPKTAKAGDVLDVRPAPGTTVALDDQITLVLATGQSPMPKVTGLTEADARAALAAAGFTDVRVTSQINGDVAPGSVFMQNPEQGVPSFRINPVFIYIAIAPPPPPKDNCPGGDYSGNEHDGQCGTPPPSPPVTSASSSP